MRRQGAYMGGDAAGQASEIVTTFKNRDQTTMTMFVGDIHSPPRDRHIATIGYIKTAQQVALLAVEAG